MNLPQHALITEWPTRWGSRQRTIERILEQHKAIQQVLSEDKKHRHLIPTWQDVEVLESINKALGPLLEFTDALSGEQQVTVFYVTPVLSLFNNDVLAVQTDDTDLTKDIKTIHSDIPEQQICRRQRVGAARDGVYTLTLDSNIATIRMSKSWPLRVRLKLSLWPWEMRTTRLQQKRQHLIPLQQYLRMKAPVRHCLQKRQRNLLEVI